MLEKEEEEEEEEEEAENAVTGAGLCADCAEWRVTL
jgi:hypothetical protein